MTNEMSGVERIAAERARQIAKEGYTPEHDDEHDDDSIAWAAVCYAAPQHVYRHEHFATSESFTDPWPWDDHCDKRPHPSDGNFPEPEKATPEQRIRLLEKAGALIAAEIDRLVRCRSVDPLDSVIVVTPPLPQEDEL